MPPQQSVPMPPPPQSVHPITVVIYTIMIIFTAVGVAWQMGYVSVSLPQANSFSDAQSSGPEDLERIIQGLEEVAETGNTSIPIMMEQNGQVSTSVAALKEGVYELAGQGAQGGKYSGTVTIIKRAQTANVYDLQWNIGSGQEQYGVGILQGGILSVGYYETMNGEVVEAGSVGYFLTDDMHLLGQWTSARGGGLGTEELTWKSAR